ncbi:eukaryotic translation initiation factor 4E-binding protein 1-like isoform X2 [Myripristis murdjan]|uniref:eukaryotic translation initiation factor 4E-binding protein 1-like isoform X2 n=1 Tax=Myripristis murdjan TaxID=586833 RepID=UPI0011760D1D|nr:eukaryotic translation initiation factor 4E-binding protein 1-like isoform X2 [Myripristis murdjan]
MRIMRQNQEQSKSRKGTRIIYDRKFLLQCRTSPLARTPPSLPDIPGVTRPHKPQGSSQADAACPNKRANKNAKQSLQADEGAGEEPLFEMDI